MYMIGNIEPATAKQINKKERKNMKKKIVIIVLLCLQAVLLAPLKAKTYDFSEEKNNTMFIQKEHDQEKLKTFQVHNISPHKIYVRIGYGSNVQTYISKCDYTGLTLNPGQTGGVEKQAFCVPVNVSGYFLMADGSKQDIPKPIIRTWMDDMGTLQWDVSEKGVEFRGHWDEQTQAWVKEREIYRPEH
jgi:hypothetical protein